ncbi:putative phosphatidylglycerol/phosphatidylinositol transfer protein DDB_G0285639 isoform X1 [Amphiura filiformis]|uniref:putative phosphatidylglycerol/phosphatidylinositol transfer protein DDB_G0285639 isoform X1 n=1 Tax=Amphiura filiformis TaxID=82378 RepID=UPI003B217B2A
MTHPNELLLMITGIAVLPFICFSYSKGGFRKLSPEEISPVSTWFPQLDSFKIKYCGPPGLISGSIKPMPPKVFKFGKLEINFTAAHDLTAGDFIVNYNRWPYHLESDACDFDWHKLGGKLCPLVKGETYFFHVAGIVDVPEIDKGHYVGNVTLINSDKEVVFCVSVDGHI